MNTGPEYRLRIISLCIKNLPELKEIFYLEKWLFG
jgi:hypothetical protein